MSERVRRNREGIREDGADECDTRGVFLLLVAAGGGPVALPCGITHQGEITGYLAL